MNTDQDLFAKARQLQRENNLTGAISLYEQLIHNNPENVQALHFLGLAHAQMGDMSQALLFLQRALLITPEDPVLHNNIANAFKKNQQCDEAMKHYQKAIQLKPDYAQAHNNMAGIYALQGQYQPALHHYNLAVHAEPDFAAAHFNLGMLFLQNNQLTAACTQFNNVLSLNPSHSEARFYQGVLFLEDNKLTEAEQAFLTIIHEDANHVEALTNLGVIALKRQQGQIAVDYFTRALAIDNDHLEARNNLAATFMHYDRFENALMHYDVLLQNEADNPEYLYNSGVAQMALGHLKEATAHFEHLLKLQPRHFAALNNLAAICIRLGDKNRARLLLENAIAANPEDKSSQHMLAALSDPGKTANTCPDYAANLFNNYSLYYDQHMQGELQYSLPGHIRRLLEKYVPGQFANTLDLGCGTGLSGQVLKPLSQKLIGVDIAGKMLDRAREKGIYDALHEAEIITFLQQDPAEYDLIVAADVLPYFGDLDMLFSLISKHLTDKGYFIFNTEISSTLPWQLQTTARFCHHSDYLQQLTTKHGLLWVHQEQVMARKQENLPLPVLLTVVKKARKL